MLLRFCLRSFTNIALIVFLGMVLPAMATADMRIFELQHRSSAELADIIRQLVSEDAKVAAHRNTLVVNASPAELDDVARLVASYDRQLQMLRITVEQGGRMTSSGRDISASGRLQSGSAQIDVQRHSGPTDSSVMVGTGNGQLLLSGRDERSLEQRHASQFMSVQEGSPASIRVGRAVPFTSQLRYYSRRHPHFVATVDYKDVDTGFVVLPEVQGGMVHLEIRPFMTFLDSKNPNRIVFRDLSSHVSVPLGSWLDLGGHLSSSNGLGREILGVGTEAGADTHRVRIRVDLQ